jgi:hypothetical protein
MALLSKAADITVPLVLAFIGFYSIPYVFWIFLLSILALFIFSAGLDVLQRAYKSAIVLILILTTQGVYAYFFGLNVPHDRGFWSLCRLPRRSDLRRRFFGFQLTNHNHSYI